LNSNVFNYLKDHCVDGAVAFLGSAYVEAGLAVHREVCDQKELILKNLNFQKALVLEERNETLLRFTYDEQKREFVILSKHCEKDSQWVKHASGELSAVVFAQAYSPDLGALREHCNESVDVEDLYKQLWCRGLQYGPSFRGIQRLWRTCGQVLANIEIPNSTLPGGHVHYLHPTVLDACFQSLTAALDTAAGETQLYLPVRIGKVRYCTSVSYNSSFGVQNLQDWSFNNQSLIF